MKKVKIAVLVILIISLIFVLSDRNLRILLGYDWLHTYRPAALAVAHGESPYSVDIYFAAPWAVIPLIPFALLPEQLGNVAVFLLGLFAFTYIAYRLNARPAEITIFLLSAPIVGCLMWGNIEWMPLLGLILPAPISLIFALIKPQVGIGIVIYWFIYLLRTQGPIATIKAFLPVTLITLLSFWLYGPWPLRFRETLALSLGNARYNTSLWPYSIFIGLWLLYKSIQNHKIQTAGAASPFLSPYVLQFTWVAVLASVIGTPWELVVVSIGLWIAVAIRYLGLL